MPNLLNRVIEAHGGLERWNQFNTVNATIVTGGALWGMKGLHQDPDPREMTVWLREERASVIPFGARNQLTAFTPGRIAIETTEGASSPSVWILAPLSQGTRRPRPGIRSIAPTSTGMRSGLI